MILKNLIKKIKTHRGAVLVEIANFNDTYWIQAVKSDLIVQLSAKFNLNDETGFELDDNGYLGKDYIDA